MAKREANNLSPEISGSKKANSTQLEVLNLAGMDVDSVVLVKILIKDIDKKYIDDHALLKKDIENAIKLNIAIAVPQTIIFKMSLSKSEIPQKCKCANVTPFSKRQ
jgi:hypothetical protein